MSKDTEAASQPREGDGLAWRLDRIREDGGPLTASDKGILREAAAALTQRPPEQAGKAPFYAGYLAACDTTEYDVDKAWSEYAPEQAGAVAIPSEWPTAEQLEAEGKAPWQGEQPIQQHAKMRRGRQWVPLEAAEAELQFWQRRDFQHAAALRAHEIALAHAMLSAAPTPPDAGIGSDGAGERV